MNYVNLYPVGMLLGRIRRRQSKAKITNISDKHFTKIAGLTRSETVIFLDTDHGS